MRLAILVVVAQLMWTLPFVVAYLLVFGDDGFKDSGPPPGFAEFVVRIFLMPIGAVIEEIVRLAPIVIVARVFRDAQQQPLKVPVLIACIVMAFLFGIAHMPNGLPFTFVLGAQAVGGLLYNLAFVKLGGLDDSSSALRAGAWTSLMHYAFNVSVMSISLLGLPT